MSSKRKEFEIEMWYVIGAIATLTLWAVITNGIASIFDILEEWCRG